MLGTDRVLYINGLRVKVKKRADPLTQVRFDIIVEMLNMDAELVKIVKALLKVYS